MPDKNQLELDLFTVSEDYNEYNLAYKWPSNDLFPLNLPLSEGYRNVREVIVKEAQGSKAYLIITGFTSLNYLVTFLSEEIDWSKMQKVRILLGWEPKGKKRRKWSPAEVGKEVKEYWLEQGLWLEQGGAVLKLTQLLKEGKVEVRYFRHQHSKIYVGDSSVVFGSANFSGHGTTQQREFNVRVTKELTKGHPDVEDVRLVAENYYTEGQDYQQNLLRLLKSLMDVVSWPEALARAISELLDTQWYREIPACAEKLNRLSLWPCQSQGLAESMALLQQHHCVLIADPTGSGKTRMIAAIQAALIHALWAQGSLQNLHVQVVCPPSVRTYWEEELRKVAVFSKSVSFGVISREGSEEHKATLESLRQVRILIIDEAHNLLNPYSNRSFHLSKHRADYVLLTTATPINRSLQDLLRILELLDLDNLTREQLEGYRHVYRIAKSRKLGEEEHRLISSFVQQFLVRRTKPLLRHMIQREPEAYRNAKGERCAYPELRQETYETFETEEDKAIARRIEELAGGLRGVLYLRRFEAPQRAGLKPEDYVARRVRMAPFLARYLVMSRLRSSAFALKEHIIGTKEAAKAEDWENFKVKGTGNLIAKLEEALENLPSTKALSDSAFADHMWLVDQAAYERVCREEINIYQRILEESEKLSENRELHKALKLKELLSKHKLLIAFDSTVSTLHYLNKKYLQLWEIKVEVVTGGVSKLKALEDFGLGSKTKNVIGLFSDALSEGVNLQQASGLVFLTIPGVIRLAEQRIGRIERLDSPHKMVHIYWPNDSDAFALRTDRNLFRAAFDVASTIGSNFHPPLDLVARHEMNESFATIGAKEAMWELDQLRELEEKTWQGLDDAFAPVKSLYHGNKALISAQMYEQIRPVRTAVKVRIGLVKADKSWFFLATRGRQDAPPKWFFFDEQDRLHDSLKDISHMLQVRLTGSDYEPIKWNDASEALLKSYRKKVEALRLELLPVKRQTAIKVGEALARKQHLKTVDPELKDLLWHVKRLSTNGSREGEYHVDFHSLSQVWLDLLQERLIDYRRKRGKREVTTMEDLLKSKSLPPFSLLELKKFQNLVFQTLEEPFDIAACILGTPAATDPIGS